MFCSYVFSISLHFFFKILVPLTLHFSNFHPCKRELRRIKNKNKNLKNIILKKYELMVTKTEQNKLQGPKLKNTNLLELKI